MHGARRAEARGRDVVAGEDVQHLHEVRAARARRPHRDDLVPPIRATHRFALDHAVGIEVFHRDQAAVCRHVCRDHFTDRATIERVRATHGDRAQRFRVVRAR